MLVGSSCIPTLILSESGEIVGRADLQLPGGGEHLVPGLQGGGGGHGDRHALSQPPHVLPHTRQLAAAGARGASGEHSEGKRTGEKRSDRKLELENEMADHNILSRYGTVCKKKVNCFLKSRPDFSAITRHFLLSGKTTNLKFNQHNNW